jgi:hypothetical protein
MPRKGYKHTEESKAKMRNIVHSKKKYCKNGHERTPENVYVDGRCKLCTRINAKNSTWKKRNPKKATINDKRQKLKRLGWTLESYEAAQTEQGGRCAICNQIPERSLHSDHAHGNPPKPRDLLCCTCNVGLGMFKDSPDILEAAAQYARKWKQETQK